MKRFSICAILATMLGAPLLLAQAPSGDVVRLDPALDAIVSPNAKVEIIKGDQAPQPGNFFYFGFLEGPLWVQDGQNGHLLFSDIAANVIYKYTPQDGKVSLFLEKSGFTGSDANNAGQQANNGRVAILLLGSNGLTLDPQGRLVIAAMADRAVARIEKDGSRTTLADKYEGKRLNGPNDVVVRSDGAVYFTDMTAGMRGGATSPSRELPFTGVYVVKDGQLRLLDKDPQQTNPNGIVLSPDEKTLYVNGGRKIWRYDLQPDGTAANGRVIVDMNKETAPGGTDGMRVDQKGNLYCTGPGGVWIMSPDGKHLGTIRTPENVTNLTFGDPDGKTIYMTHRRNLYRIRVNVPGVRPGVRTSSSVTATGQTASRAGADTDNLPGAEAARALVAARTAKNWVPPKKPWGHPDIEGIFTTKDEYNTPFERPDEWAGRRMEDIPPAELAAATLKRTKESEKRIGEIRQLEWIVPGTGPKGPVSPFDFSLANSRPWFVIDPPDGKVPPLTAEGKARRVPGERGADTYTDRSISERCLTYGALRAPGPSGNSHQIIQTPTHVVIRLEQIHEARIVPLDGRPHPNPSVRGYFGVSRGHWDGNTLVVVTTNFAEKMDFRSSPLGNARVIERFTRIAPNKVEWTTTYDDPTTWTRPWSWSLPLTQDDKQMIFEFACHEGNTGVPNILTAGRALEKKQAREGAQR